MRIENKKIILNIAELLLHDYGINVAIKATRDNKHYLAYCYPDSYEQVIYYNLNVNFEDALDIDYRTFPCVEKISEFTATIFHEIGHMIHATDFENEYAIMEIEQNALKDMFNSFKKTHPDITGVELDYMYDCLPLEAMANELANTFDIEMIKEFDNEIKSYINRLAYR